MPAQKYNKSAANSDQLYARLKLKSLTAETKLKKRHPQAAKFFEGKGLRPGRLREHAAKILTSGALAGSIFLTGQPILATPSVIPATNKAIALATPPTIRQDLSTKLKDLLPQKVRPLTSEEENNIGRIINSEYGINATAQLEGNHLNQTYGLIGAEQHLPRFPGDSIYEHQDFQDKGLTPGLGAWGYFAQSKEQMTPELYDTEKYYVAVQTLYLPDWNTNTRYLYNWYKYRHVVVVNPVNGKAIVAAIADAGPADWTGKHFGGSPELMAYLGLNKGMQKGPVVLFFLDDPGKTIPLGPLEYNVKTGNPALSFKS